MKAVILAAGRGERMKPLTDTCPKPLLKVKGIPLIEHHINRLVKAGITDITINLAWLGDKIADYLQDGSQLGANISYSRETQGALETAGGIAKILQQWSVKSDPFLVINGDVYCDIDYAELPLLAAEKLAHLWLVDNPSHNKLGDFMLQQGNVKNIEKVSENAVNSFTFSGIALYRPSFFNQVNGEQKKSLGPMLKDYADKSVIVATHHQGLWTDVGTPERLQQLNQ